MVYRWEIHNSLLEEIHYCGTDSGFSILQANDQDFLVHLGYRLIRTTPHGGTAFKLLNINSKLISQYISKILISQIDKEIK